MLDLVLRNATVIDGSGSPRFVGDVAIAEGQIAAVGIVSESGQREIDLKGAALAPGFIDIHTHYDAQVFWDPMVTPSINHGVTTVIAGNCGFTLAPLSGRAEDTDYLVRMLSRVEGMPLSTLQEALSPDWTTFGEYLDRLDQKLAINATFLVGHSALRRAVMGDAAVGREATPEEIDAMCELLDQSLAQGGVGFSSSISATHSDLEGEPVPSRWASRAELLRLASVVARHPGTWLEIAHGKTLLDHEQYDILAELSLASGRPINWNLVTVDSRSTEEQESQVRAGDFAAERGATVIGLVPSVPPKIILNFSSGFVIDTIPGWSEVLVLPQEEKLAALADPTVRRRMIEGALRIPSPSLARRFEDWGDMIIEAVGSAERKDLVGTRLGDHAAALNQEPLETLFDLVVAEQLVLSFSPPTNGCDEESWRQRGELWRDPRCLIGGSDAGAHLDMINTFAFSTQLLGEGVRKRGLLPLEEAVHRITALPAEKFGLIGRGAIAAGMAADLVVFDPESVDCGPVLMRDDLPGGATRLTADAIGIAHVFVNGVQVIENGRLTGDKGGRILRSGRDTRTVALPVQPSHQKVSA